MGNKNWYKELSKIKGIGKETAEDLGFIFDTEEKFMDALVFGRIPIRNDKVVLLTEYFINNDYKLNVSKKVAKTKKPKAIKVEQITEVTDENCSKCKFNDSSFCLWKSLKKCLNFKRI